MSTRLFSRGRERPHFRHPSTPRALQEHSKQSTPSSANAVDLCQAACLALVARSDLRVACAGSRVCSLLCYDPEDFNGFPWLPYHFNVWIGWFLHSFDRKWIHICVLLGTPFVDLSDAFRICECIKYFAFLRCGGMGFWEKSENGLNLEIFTSGMFLCLGLVRSFGHVPEAFLGAQQRITCRNMSLLRLNFGPKSLVQPTVWRALARKWETQILCKVMRFAQDTHN